MNTDYLMLIDLDELIVPHHQDHQSVGGGNNNRTATTTIRQMIDHLNSGKVTTKAGQPLKLPSPVSSYSFQNAFFYLQFPDDDSVTAKNSSAHQDLRLRVLAKTRR